MHFEHSIEIDAPQQRVWDVLSDIEGWPSRIETVESAEVLEGPLAQGARVRLRQPKLSAGTWDITTWQAPTFFEWMQKSLGATIVAGHRVEPLGDARSHLTLTIEMGGLLGSIMGRFYADLTNRYMTIEAEGLKRAAEGQ
ncbi:MAG TPA: SRPBCC family protein [Candidatus Binatia bacterium]|nr:SRPBCC family protein [Candidatus Binatia bacterium]